MLIYAKEVINTRISILPKTPLGKWSVWLAIAIILVGVGDGLFVSLTGHEHLNGSVELMILGIALTLLVIGAIVMGLISIIRSKERSILVFLVVVLGLFVSVFLPGFFISGWG